MFAKFRVMIFSAFMALTFVLTFSVPSTAFAQLLPPDPNAPAQPAPPPSESDRFWKTVREKAFGKQPTFEERRNDAVTALGGLTNCWACKVFNEFGKQIFSSGKAADAAGKTLIPVVSGFASVFALFYLGSGFIAGDASDLPQRWTVFWRLMVSVAFGTAVLSAGAFSFVWDYVYDPLFSIGTGVAGVFASDAVQTSCDPGAIKVGGFASADATLEAMYKVVCGGHNISIQGIATGLALGTHVDGVVNTLFYGISGLVIVFMYLWIMISFPLRFIDVLIRLGIVGMITPLLVIAAVFKPTRGYISIGISNVLNATAQFAITAVMFAIGSKVFTDMTSTLKLDANASGSIWVQNSTAVSAISSSVVMIGMAAIFAGMLRSVPAIAAEFSQYRGSGGDQIGNSAIGAAANSIAMPIKGVGMVAGASAAKVALGGAGAKGLAKGVSGAATP